MISFHSSRFITFEVDMKILTINSGSSSLKVGLYEMGVTENLVLSGALSRIGLRTGAFQIHNSSGKPLADEHADLPDHETALKELVPFAPDHLPHEIKAILATQQYDPDLVQVACFDTAFHQSMPRLAQIYALPRHYQREGMVRYGFHGLSYEYILQELRKEAGDEAADGQLIIAHLGNGASMAAVRQGKSVDTTMGFTPAGGLVMSTRSGDVDPGLLVYLLEEKNLRPSAINDLVNRYAGLLGVSGISSDMKDLLDQEEREPHAREAVDLFCYQASKYLGALAAVLGGIDTLIFTAGIGANSPSVRQRICQNLSFLGIHLDAARNASNAAIISLPEGPVTVRVMRTDEDLMIARHTFTLIQQKNLSV
jgi:acetate kinase